MYSLFGIDRVMQRIYHIRLCLSGTLNTFSNTVRSKKIIAIYEHDEIAMGCLHSIISGCGNALIGLLNNSNS